MEIKHEERRELRRRRDDYSGVGALITQENKNKGDCVPVIIKTRRDQKENRKGKNNLNGRLGEKSLGCVITNNIIVHFGNIDIVLVRLGRHTLILYN